MKYPVWRNLCFLLFLLTGNFLSAQQELTLYFSNNVIQSGALNPAFVPEEKTVVGLPSFVFNYGNNAFTYNELIKKRADDSTYLDIDQVLSGLSKENIIQTQQNLDILRLYYRHKNIHFNFHISEKFSTKVAYSSALIELLWKGNVASVNNTLQIGPAINIRYYREMGLGAAFPVKDFYLGFKLKLLNGIADISTLNHISSIYTQAQDYAIYLETDYHIRTSGVQNLLNDPLSSSLGFDNNGIALDLGLTYSLNENTRLSASLINLGFINWTKDVKNYKSKGTFTYEGVALNAYFQTDTLSVQALADTVRTIFFPLEDDQSYKSQLVPRVYIGMQHQLSESARFGALLFLESVKGLQPAAALSYHRIWDRRLATGISWSYKNKRLNNLGLSLTGHFGRLQYFLISDNVITLFVPADAKNINFRLGFNLVLKK